MRNTYVVGDIHGRFDLLCKTIDIIERDAGADGGTFIVLGDFVDRGPNSAQIIDLLMAGPKRPNWRWIVLQGNHESMMLECLAGTAPLQWWLRNGGSETLKSYGYQDGDRLTPSKIPQDHLDWLANLPVWHTDTHRLFVHAGCPHDKPHTEVKAEVLQWMLYRDGENYDGAIMADDYPHVSGLHIVHGHHQSVSHPLRLEHRTNLDSFAWYCGRLAIGIFNDTQAKPVRILDAIGLPDRRYA